MTNQHLVHDGVWLSQSKYEDAERVYQEVLAGTATSSQGGGLASNLVNEIVEARQKIQQALTTPGNSGSVDSAVLDRLSLLERENQELKKVTQDLRNLVNRLEGRVVSLEKGAGITTPAPQASQPDDHDDDDDDDFDLFDDDPEADAAADKLKEERLKKYAEKKAKKPGVIAKSSLLIDVKPWDDETDMKEIERCVRTIEMDGLVWGAAKLIPVGYGIKKLQIMAVVEDEKISTDDLEEKITGFEDLVQSMDIAAFNKI